MRLSTETPCMRVQESESCSNWSTLDSSLCAVPALHHYRCYRRALKNLSIQAIVNRNTKTINLSPKNHQPILRGFNYDQYFWFHASHAVHALNDLLINIDIFILIIYLLFVATFFCSCLDNKFSETLHCRHCRPAMQHCRPAMQQQKTKQNSSRLHVSSSRLRSSVTAELVHFQTHLAPLTSNRRWRKPTGRHCPNWSKMRSTTSQQGKYLMKLPRYDKNLI